METFSWYYDKLKIKRQIIMQGFINKRRKRYTHTHTFKKLLQKFRNKISVNFTMKAWTPK